MPRPKVSALLATYNREKFVAESLRSIFTQTLPPTQVIVVNDGSTDGTTAALEPFRSRIDYMESENSGKAAALNLGMPRVSGDYVWIMDDDDVAMSDALERHVATLESRPELGWTYSSYVESATNRENFRITPQREKVIPNFPQDEFLVRLMEQCFLIHPTILVRASCYRELGPFDTALVRCQDYEMAVRLARRFPCARISGPTIYYRMHGGSRGSARDTFAVGQIQGKWLEYMQVFMRKLRKEMALAEYLPGGKVRNGGSSDLRYAYLRRMGIMTRKRLYEEMIEDLQLAVGWDTTDSSALTAAERRLLHELFNSINDPYFFQKEVLGKIRAACKGPVGSAIRRELIRCLYWEGRNAVGKGAFSVAFNAATAAARLFGADVFRSFFRDRRSE